MDRSLLFCSLLEPSVPKAEDCMAPFCSGMGQGPNLISLCNAAVAAVVNAVLVPYTNSTNALATIDLDTHK